MILVYFKDLEKYNKYKYILKMYTKKYKVSEITPLVVICECLYIFK